MTLEERIQKFRCDMLRKQPFYGDIIMNLEFRRDDSIPTACTDGRRVMYNPKFLTPMTDGQVNFVLMHEVLHILLLHCSRGRGKDPQLWNIAADMIVNDALTSVPMYKAMKESRIPFERPADGIFVDGVWDDDSTENLYAWIVNNNKGRKKGDRLTVSRRLNNSDTGKLDRALPKPHSGQVGGDLMKPEGSALENEALAAEIQQIIRQASSKAKGRGLTASAPVPDEVFGLTETKRLNWKALLKGMLTNAQSDESSWSTPERKYLHMDMILPGHTEDEETLEEVWAFVDSSGSVGRDEMSQFLTQLHRILKEFHCVMHLAYWDTSVTDVYRSIKTEKKLLECLPRHSGGTDINCVYRWIRENKVKPGVMLVLTDGYFGQLTEENGRLRRNTIVVLSEKAAKVDDNIKKVGRPASLQEDRA